MAKRKQKELLNVVVPCLNEEGNVRITVEEILRVAADLPVRVQVHVIDDGSRDGTWREIQKLADEHGVSPHQNEQNKGLGRTVMESWQRMDPQSWCTVLPGDNEIAFSSIHNFLEVRDRFDIILGYVQNPVIRTLKRRIASTAFMRISNALYGFTHRYLNGMKMYRVWALSGIPVQSSGYAFNAELMAKAVLRNPQLRMGEVPFVWRGRYEGHTKAFQPRSIVQAMREVYLGLDEVNRYRDKVLQERR